MPIVNVVIPTFNRAYCIEKAIVSVLNQTFKDFELWVIDDGSTDNTDELLNKYKSDKRFNYFKIKNAGVSKARNIGVSKSESEWIAFLDSDDEWLEDKLERQIQYVKEHSDCKLIHGEELWVRNGKRVNPKKIHKKSGGDIFERSLGLCLISPSAVMLKKDLFIEMNGFDEDFIVCEDYDLWLKICSRYEVGYLSEPVLIKYGGHEDQLSAKYFAMDYYRIKSMHQLNENKNLNKLKKIALFNMIIKKSKILLKGYQKHNNLKDYSEIEYYYKKAQEHLDLIEA